MTYFPPSCSPDLRRVAFIGDTSLSFGEVRSKAGAIADALGAAGLQPGNKVAIATSQGASIYTCFAACWYYGFPLVILDPLSGAGELESMIHKAAPSAFIADDEILQRLAVSPVENLPRSIWRTGPSRTKGTRNPWAGTSWKRTVYDYPSLDELDLSTSAPVEIAGGEELPAYIIFTSGSTSNPKAVVVSRDALSYHVATLSRVFGYDQDARLLHYLPTHHTDGLVHGIAASLLTGMTIIHPGRFTSQVNLGQTLREKKISHFLTVPTMLSIIRRNYGDQPDLFKHSDFRNLISTAGYLDPKFWEEFQKFYDVRVSNFYGMTETVSGSLYCGPDDDTYRIGTVGKPVDTQVRIVNEVGVVTSADKVGELQVTGRHLMSAYLDDPEATQDAIADGWLSTGDLFFQDTDGFFHIVGRKKDIIKRGGITIYPEDIRTVLVDMPGVIEVEVIGFPNADFEEIIVVCAVTEDGVDANDIREFCRSKLSPERHPDRVVLRDWLPRGPSGKIQREALISELEQITAHVESRDDSIQVRVFNLAAEVFATDPSDLNLQSSPDSVDNWDSFASMEFVLALEKEFGLRLGARNIMRIRNIGLAIEVVSSATGSITKNI